MFSAPINDKDFKGAEIGIVLGMSIFVLLIVISFIVFVVVRFVNAKNLAINKGK
ncbi:hypothetical protein [Peribacillus asahii]|uniref:hypothetical protein n=1 Tax=Peribacillus asahii TaxID=228899 RepID=UPI00381AAE9D